MKRKLILTIGISGSGKSTLCDLLYGSVPHVRLSRDSIRKELCGREEDHSREVEVGRTVMIRLRETLKDTADTRPIIIDTTALLYKDRSQYYQMVKDCGLVLGQDIELLFLHINMSPTDAINQQMQRERKVPENVIHRQHNQLQHPAGFEFRDGIPYQMITFNGHVVGGI